MFAPNEELREEVEGAAVEARLDGRLCRREETVEGPIVEREEEGTILICPFRDLDLDLDLDLERERDLEREWGR